MIKQKKCKACGQILDISEFTTSKRIKDGYENKCKKCRYEAKKGNHTLICKSCGKEFKSAKSDAMFCSRECSGKKRRVRVTRTCKYCGKNVEVSLSKSQRQDVFYCNQKCRTEDLKTLMKGNRNPNYNRVKYKCDGCGKEIMVIPYQLENQKYVFCSNNCYKTNIGKYFSGINNGNYSEEVETTCSVCGKNFKRKPGQLKYKRHYCSRQCYMNAKERTEINGKIEVSCDHCGKKFKIYQSRKNIVKHIYCSMECRNIHQGKLYRGENHPRYNDELSDEERELNRKYTDYYLWRKSVYERDNYTCKCCGDSSGGNLVAHHIISYRSDKEKQTLIDNGITLCEKCHKLFHDNFGYGNNDVLQLEEFLEIYDQFGVNGFEDD